MTRDKLDRCRNAETSVATQAANVPFWCTLTSRERRTMSGTELGHFFRRHAADRKALRDFIRTTYRKATP